MPGVERLGLDEALSHIRQTCERRAGPFCFVVGAGISNPPVKLTFSIEIPELTSDPLGFFVKQMSGSLPKGKDDEKVADIYSIGAVIDRIQRAKDYEDNQIAWLVEKSRERFMVVVCSVNSWYLKMR